MAFTTNELERGMNAWNRNYQKKPKDPNHWPKDFHSIGYKAWDYRIGKGVLTKDWWKGFKEVIGQFDGLQGARYADLSSKIEFRLFGQLNNLHRAWYPDIDILVKQGKDIEEVGPEEIEEFVKLVDDIKPTQSPWPLFTAQLCHLALAPRIFPLNESDILNQFKVNSLDSSYMKYYTNARNQWLETHCAVRNKLMSYLKTGVQCGAMERVEKLKSTDDLVVWQELRDYVKACADEGIRERVAKLQDVKSQEEWRELINYVKVCVERGKGIDAFPLKTKVIELCYIGKEELKKEKKKEKKKKSGNTSR